MPTVIETPSILLPPEPKPKTVDQQKHCRCLNCNFIRYNSTTMERCPRCGERDSNRFAPSYNPAKEATHILCDALGVTPKSAIGHKISQAISIITKL